jgi:hypothetical protein
MVEFIVEDGTEVTDATSYVSVTDMEQYWENLGYDFSALSTSDEQVLLNKATKVIDNYYLEYWPGQRVTETQSLEWPRQFAKYVDGTLIDNDVIPKELKNAVCEMAYINNAGIDLQPTVGANGVAIITTDRVEGAVTEHREYLKGSVNAGGRSRLLAVEDALARLLSGSAKRLFIQRI